MSEEDDERSAALTCFEGINLWLLSVVVILQRKKLHASLHLLDGIMVLMKPLHRSHEVRIPRLRARTTR